MKIPTHNFNRLSSPSTAKKPKENKPTPFSLRLTFEERALLEQDAADRDPSKPLFDVGLFQFVQFFARGDVPEFQALPFVGIERRGFVKETWLEQGRAVS